LQQATYTSFEQVSTIDEGDYHAAFTYNSDGQRAKMLVTNLGSTILTRWYVGSRYIKETEGATTKEYTWIGGDAYTAPVVAITQSGSTSWYYLLRDYLGNITHQVNTSNTVTAEYSYDAWGRRRDKDDWSYTLSGEPDLLAGRSFTSHEYLPWFKLVNMNGRLYDPLLGRFLSPDNYVQLPDFSQNYNRYTYCLNNPLIYTDPSGELIGELIYIAAMTYFGGVQANFMHAANTGGNPFNPGDWNWKSPWTYIGMAASGLGAYSQIGGLNGFATDALNPSKLFNIPKDPNFLAFATDGGPGKVRLLQNGLYEAQYSINTVYAYGRDLSKVAAITQKIHQGHLAFFNHPMTQLALTLLPIAPEIGAMKWISRGSEAVKPLTQFAANTSPQGFKSFSAFKRVLGPAGKGQAWHHVVEQNPANIAKFGPEAIHNKGNLIKLPHGAGSIHAKVSGHYNSLMPGTSMRVRDYVNTLNFQQQYQYGLDVLKRFGY